MALFEFSSAYIDGSVVYEVGRVGGVSLVHSETKETKETKT